LPGAFRVSAERGVVACCFKTGEGPVTQETMASPKGLTLQLVPGALHDLS
jgi:hypothetical protein